MPIVKFIDNLPILIGLAFKYQPYKFRKRIRFDYISQVNKTCLLPRPFLLQLLYTAYQIIPIKTVFSLYSI